MLLLVASAQAATVQVLPGDGTLAAAVAAASDGDVLLLDGQYAGEVTVNKSLSIRSHGFIGQAHLGSTLTIDAPGKTVLIQGLSLPTLNVQAGADVRIVQNRFLYGLSLDGYRDEDGDGRLFVVGNHWPSGYIRQVRVTGALIAGNRLDDGFIDCDAACYVLGNSVVSSRTSDGDGAIHAHADASTIAGNRVVRIRAANSAYGIYAEGTSALVAGNLVVLQGPTADQDTFAGIRTYGLVENNVLDATGVDPSATGSAYLFGVYNASRAAGNIIVGFQGGYGYALRSVTYAEANLCWNGTRDCGTANGNLSQDPGFADGDDYRLAADSPCIDAGPADLRYTDLDLTRNDIGAYGGPWSIAQFDAQREPSARGPYVYPLFDAPRFTEDGDLRVRAIGIARIP